MSETLSQDPDGLGAAYTTSYTPTPATPSSTVQDAPPGANLPPFSTFAADMDSNGAFNSVSDRLFSDTRLLDISNWDYYTEARLLERGENGLSIITSQPQYRPWESKPVDASTSTYATTTSVNTLADAFAHQNGTASKLPSFQSQFQSFNDPATTTEPTLTTLTNLTPVSPNNTAGTTTFHTLSAVNMNMNMNRYPLVPAPIQAREVPAIQQQFLDERHIQLYSHHPGTNITTFLNNQNGTIIHNNQVQVPTVPTVVTVLKSEPDNLKLGLGLHPAQFQNPLTNTDGVIYNGIDKKINGGLSGTLTSLSPTRNDFRKKERRKIRASSLESSVDSDGASSNMDLGSENSGQVAAVSSTAGYKGQHQMHVDMDADVSGGNVDKQVKKKRKRCGECIGCQRKDNCGDCAPCRNDKSHQICKQRRCEKLTEKKNLYQDGFLRGESRRGRGKGRGGASYRGRKPAGSSAPLGSGTTLVPSETNGGSIVAPSVSVQPASRPSPQPAPVQQPMPVQQQPMTPMPFYADPNRFPTPVWQADPSQGWTQGQFIQQLPPTAQPIETYQQYPNGIYQTTYQQPAFETTNTFYTGAVQVLTNPRPSSTPTQQVTLAPPTRPNSNYSHHTPSPSPVPVQNNNNSSNRQYQQEYQQQNFNNGDNTTGTTGNSSSRPGSVNMNPPTPNNQQNFSPTSSYVNQNSGNALPGYPQVNHSNPQLTSHNSSGYPGQESYSGHEQQWDNQIWQQQEQEPSYEDDTQYHSPTKKEFSQSEKVNLNTRIKTMILNKQEGHNNGTKIEENKSVEQNSSTGHFLSYSHHHQLVDDGGDQNRFDSKFAQLSTLYEKRNKLETISNENRTKNKKICSAGNKTKNTSTRYNSKQKSTSKEINNVLQNHHQILKNQSRKQMEGFQYGLKSSPTSPRNQRIEIILKITDKTVKNEVQIAQKLVNFSFPNFFSRLILLLNSMLPTTPKLPNKFFPWNFFAGVLFNYYQKLPTVLCLI